MKYLIYALLLFTTSSLDAQDQLYKVSLLRAKPGELLKLIKVINEDFSKYENYLEHKPYMLRHSQGDHWDLMIIYPIEEIHTYFSEAQIELRNNSNSIEKPYGDSFFDLVSFQEEAIAKGPSVNAFIDSFEKYSLFHVEIFTSLAGKQNELLEQRLSENQFYAGIEHRPNFIFTRVFGPSWDNFTIGCYEDLHDFAGPDVPFEKEDQAAKEAGFDGVNYIGSYLRSLIDEHHDTLAWKVN